MTVYQVYEQTIKPLSQGEKLTIARLIMEEVAPDTASGLPAGMGFDALQRLLPQIERITFTDHDLAGVVLSGSQSE